MRDITLEFDKQFLSSIPDDVAGIPDFLLTAFRSTEGQHNSAALRVHSQAVTRHLNQLIVDVQVMNVELILTASNALLYHHYVVVKLYQFSTTLG